jgi:hypothetical protein
MSTGDSPKRKAPKVAAGMGVGMILALVFGIVLVVAIFIALLVPAVRKVREAASEASAPTEAMAKKVIEDRYKADVATGFVRLNSVRKTGAQDAGRQVQCEVEFEFMKEWNGTFTPFLSWMAADELEEGLRGKYSKGEKVRVKTHVDFKKTEKAWMPVNKEGRRW